MVLAGQSAGSTPGVLRCVFFKLKRSKGVRRNAHKTYKMVLAGQSAGSTPGVLHCVFFNWNDPRA